MPLSLEKEFVYTFASKDTESVLRVPVVIPVSQPAQDLTGRLIFEHNLPCYIEKGLSYSLFGNTGIEWYLRENTVYLTSF